MNCDVGVENEQGPQSLPNAKVVSYLVLCLGWHLDFWYYNVFANCIRKIILSCLRILNSDSNQPDHILS